DDIDAADKAEAALVDGADQPLCLAVIADDLTDRLDPARESRLRYDAAMPDRFEDVIAADDAIAVLHEVDEQGENLRLDRQHRLAVAQLLRADIELEAVKTIKHGRLAPVRDPLC